MVRRMSNIKNDQISIVGDHCIDREGPSMEEMAAIDRELKRRKREAIVAHAE